MELRARNKSKKSGRGQQPRREEKTREADRDEADRDEAEKAAERKRGLPCGRPFRQAREAGGGGGEET